MPLKTRDLAVFDAVVSTGSVQGAARAMGLTQSAVSRVIQRLEDALGCTLLDRAQRPIGLTRDGERAVAHARAVLSAVETMETAFRDSPIPAGRFRLGLPHALTSLLLDPGDLLGLQDFPQLRPVLLSGWSDELLAKLDARALDAAITLSRPDQRRAGARALASAPVKLVGAGALEAQAERLETANAVGWALNPTGCGYRKALADALGALGETPNIVLETNALELQLRFAREGRAFTLAPHLPHRPGSPLGAARFFETRDFDAGVTVFLHPARGEPALGPVFDRIARRARVALGGIP